VRDVFALDSGRLNAALRAVRAYAQAEREGRGAVMIDGEMYDRATDRVNRTLLRLACGLGQLGDDIAAELRLLPARSGAADDRGRGFGGPPSSRPPPAI